ncbi:MAG: CCA tRNA nucleotidyltransferase [Candidatus Bathyarchaeota archaeon]|nr:MAG: CCA tRNA nucleotidyltransferase [Candidatus Bathyarchaeota archaeon]
MLDGTDWTRLRDRILARIVPDISEHERLEEFRARAERELTQRLRESGLKAVAEVHGSAARGTWIAGERDIDVFVVLDDGYDRDVLPIALDVAKAYVGDGWVEAYAEHPYIRARVDGFDVDFVPCFAVDPAAGLISSTDRTPLHTGFVTDKLPTEGRDEVRLLKRFMEGVGVYGAEVKVGGFSGYLCELLVIRHGSFEAVLEAAEGWTRGEVMDVVGSSDAVELSKRFDDPLIVMDPVDDGRNVASAVSETSFWTFVAASRAFLKEPKEIFFYPREESVDISGMLDTLRERGSRLLFLVVEDGEVEVPDVLWGQLYKTEKAIARQLREAGFQLIRSTTWSDEASRYVLVFELETEVLPQIMIRKGPPVGMADDGERFVRAHIRAENTVSGPWIDGDRWWVEKLRPKRDAGGLLESLLADGGREIGVSRGLVCKIERNGRVLIGEGIAEFLEPEFSLFLQRFLMGRPDWLE